MKPVQPYQPLLLRILHGLTGVFLVGAVLTAFWTYNTYDARWGKAPLPDFRAIEGVHGTFGLWTLLIFPAFVVYAFHRGQRRLVQSDSFAQLAKFGKPGWWYTLNRFTNTFTLIALTFALFSGKMMSEKWLPRGELDHAWYYAHLIAWVIVVIAIALHLLMNAKVGGVPFLLSMLNWQFRDPDSPKLWSTHLSNWWSNLRQSSWTTWLQSVQTMAALELIILTSIVAAWIIPLFK